jgi:hypothetical protein
MSIKPIYTVGELASMMSISRFRALRILRRARVPIQPGKPGLVYLSDLKAMAPDVWMSMEEAAHLRALAD